MAAQGRPDRGGRDLDAQPEELALDALVALARVLSGKADDQLLDVLIERWTPTPAAGIGPGVGDQAAVPAQQSLGVTRKQDQWDLGSTRLIAASRARSVGSSLGRWTWRRNTVS
jgi:hypothetical protein